MAGFKSHAQRAKLAELVKSGKMHPDVYQKMHQETAGKLPERVGAGENPLLKKAPQMPKAPVMPVPPLSPKSIPKIKSIPDIINTRKKQFGF